MREGGRGMSTGTILPYYCGRSCERQAKARHTPDNHHALEIGLRSNGTEYSVVQHTVLERATLGSNLRRNRKHTGGASPNGGLAAYRPGARIIRPVHDMAGGGPVGCPKYVLRTYY